MKVAPVLVPSLRSNEGTPKLFMPVRKPGSSAQLPELQLPTPGWFDVLKPSCGVAGLPASAGADGTVQPGFQIDMPAVALSAGFMLASGSAGASAFKVVVDEVSGGVALALVPI